MQTHATCSYCGKKIKRIAGKKDKASITEMMEEVDSQTINLLCDRYKCKKKNPDLYELYRE